MMPILYAVGLLGGLGLILGLLLTVAGKKFHVEVDPRVAKSREHLAGANCGACGFAGCDMFAEAVARGEAGVGGCKPGGAATAGALAAIMGVEADEMEPMVARVICQGHTGIAKDRYTYDGYKSCRVAGGIAGGPKLCRFACLGLGDCMVKCAFDAISMRDGLAAIDADRCVGCGVCVEECPRGAIQLLPKEKTVYVQCRNSDVARVARDLCMTACIACGRCKKACQYDAITVEGGFARIDPDKCTRCGECAQMCPCKCITM